MANFLNLSAVRALLNKLIPGEAVAQVITGATTASPSVITIAANGYSSGDVIFVAGTTGTTSINGLRKVVVVSANTFTMTDFFTGAAVNVTSGTFGGSPTSQRVVDGKVPGDIIDLKEGAMDFVSGAQGPFADSQRAAESTLQTIFGQ